MFSSRNNIPVQCQVCGFPFAVLVGEGVRLVWCPSCGMEFTCKSVAVDSGDNTSASMTASDKFSAEAGQVGAIGVNVDGNIDENIIAGTIGTENNCAEGNDSDFAQNISTNHEYDNYNSLLRSSAVKRWRILFAAVSVQIIALVTLPVMIFSTTSNVDLVGGTGVVEVDGATIISNEPTTAAHISLATTTTPSNKNPEEDKQTATQSNESDKKIPSFATDSVTLKLDNVEVASVVDAPNEKPKDATKDAAVEVVEDDGDVKEVDLALDMPPLQPSVRSTKINELPQVTNLGNDRKGGGIERVIQVGSDYDPRFIESGLNVLDFGSDEVVKLPDELSTNLPFNESNENGDNTESNGGEESIGDVGGDGEEDVGLLSYEIQLDRAREQLLDGGKLSAISPERGLKAVIQAIKRFQELGQAIPVEAKWILGRAYVTQRWGEALVENIPGLADMAISADGQWLWCRCEDNTIWIWDVLRSRKTLGGFKLESGNLGIVKLVFTPDFRFAVGVGVDGLVRVWNMELPESGRSMVVLGGKVSNPVDLQISPDGRWLVVSGVVNDGVVRGGGNNGNNGNNVGANNGGNGGNGGGFVNTAINDFSGSGVVWLWDLDSVKGGEMIAAGEGLEPLVLRGHSKPIRVLKISKDSGWLATGSDDATARIYNLRSAYPGAEQTVLKGHQSGIMSVVFSVEGGWLATGGQDNTIRLWRLSGSTSPPESVELRGHIGWVGSLAVDDSGERLVSGSFDKTVRIWNIPAKNIEQASAQKPTVIQTEQGLVRQLLLTRDGKTLVSLGGDFSLRLWGIGEGGVFELGSTLLIRNRLLPITHIAITPDDRWLIFDYVNQRAPKNSGIRLLHLQLEELLKSAEELKPN